MVKSKGSIFFALVPLIKGLYPVQCFDSNDFAENLKRDCKE